MDNVVPFHQKQNGAVYAKPSTELTKCCKTAPVIHSLDVAFSVRCAVCGNGLRMYIEGIEEATEIWEDIRAEDLKPSLVKVFTESLKRSTASILLKLLKGK